MLKSVKTLKEVRKEIQEQLGVQKKLNPKNGYYFYANGKREYGMHDTKVESTMCHKDDHGLILAHFKSKKGYNSKLKNNKNFANHYAEYIAYLILKQLGKKVCKVDLGEIEIKNKYSNKIINIEGVLSQYEVTLEENFKELMVIVDSYKEEHPKKYKEMTTRGKTDSKDNYVNIEIILNTLEEYYKKNGQSDKIPQMRKEFFDMCMFDLMFANRDRSDDNCGVKVNQVTNEINFYPLFLIPSLNVVFLLKNCVLQITLCPTNEIIKNISSSSGSSSSPVTRTVATISISLGSSTADESSIVPPFVPVFSPAETAKATFPSA